MTSITTAIDGKSHERSLDEVSVRDLSPSEIENVSGGFLPVLVALAVAATTASAGIGFIEGVRAGMKS